MKRRVIFSLCIILLGVTDGMSRTSNGNELALALVEATDPITKKEVYEDAQGRPHFFRYLQIMELEETEEGIRITAFEPSSYLDVKFTVSMPVSLGIMRQEPKSKVGDALAVMGRFVALEDKTNAMLLDSPIVRYKDRLSPAIGKELLGDVLPGAVFYSYTNGPRAVHLEAQDRDLLTHRDSVLEKGGPVAWTEFLEQEVAKRKAARAAAAKEAAR